MKCRIFTITRLTLGEKTWRIKAEGEIITPVLRMMRAKQLLLQLEYIFEFVYLFQRYATNKMSNKP